MKKFLIFLFTFFSFSSFTFADECINTLDNITPNITSATLNSNYYTFYINYPNISPGTYNFSIQDYSSGSLSQYFQDNFPISGINWSNQYLNIGANQGNVGRSNTLSSYSNWYIPYTYSWSWPFTFTIRYDIHQNYYSESLFSSLTSIDYVLSSGSTPCQPTVTPPPTPSNNPFSDFLSIYLDKISFLAESFTTNPYLFSMISIIFAFIVLELFLHIYHMKGGYKK